MIQNKFNGYSKIHINIKSNNNDVYNPVTKYICCWVFFLNNTRISNLFSSEIIDFSDEFMYTLSCIFMFI